MPGTAMFGTDHQSSSNPRKSKEKTGADERRNQNRRQLKCDGYVYLPAVGWYCRRLKNRRENDIFAKDLL